MNYGDRGCETDKGQLEHIAENAFDRGTSYRGIMFADFIPVTLACSPKPKHRQERAYLDHVQQPQRMELTWVESRGHYKARKT